MIDRKPFVFRFGDVEVREREFTLIRAGEVLPVQPKIFSVLLFLLHNPQRLVAKEELLNAVWGDTAVTESSLTRIIALLRQLLGDDIGEQRYIATVAKVGYRFVCPVEVSEDAPGIPASADSANHGNGSVNEALAATPQEGGIGTFRRRWLLSAAVLALGFASVVWYLHRPLPSPRITDYTKITHDGHEKRPVGTDGTRIYFSPTIAGLPVEQVALSGGEISPVPIGLPNIHFVEDVSPDGSSLIIATGEKGVVVDRPQWNVSILGGSIRRLPDGGSGTFSPDGQNVAYATPNGEIWLVRSDGSGAHKLASAGPAPSNLAWSPDGGTVRFSRDNRLWEMSSNGLNLHELLPGWHRWLCCGHWTLDGKIFLFRSGNSASEAGSEIWALVERRSPFRKPRAEPVQLTEGPIRWEWLVPGKDGKKIFAEGVIPRGELSRFDAQSKRFLPFLGGISAGCVSFSKDGRFVVYVLYPEGTLWRANRDGSNPVQLADPPINAHNPRWSPDGTQIVFTNGQNPDEIDMVSAEGGSLRRILPEDHLPEGDPTWSPDGRKIVFSSGGGTFHPQSDLRIFDMESRQVTTVPGSVGTTSPRWSPDGRFIAAIALGSLKLEIFDIEKQQWSVLVDAHYLMGYPTWSKDSTSIYFDYWIDDPGVFRIPITGGEPERIVDLKDWHSTGWWGWMGLDPDDTPMMLHDVDNDDIYALTLEEK